MEHLTTIVSQRKGSIFVKSEVQHNFEINFYRKKKEITGKYLPSKQCKNTYKHVCFVVA